MPHRVMLLVLVTGLFAAVWNSDRSAAPLRTARLSSEIGSGRILSDKTSEPHALIAARHDATAQCSDAVHLCLPKRMAPGRFRVVDNLGEVQDLRLTAESLIALGVEREAQPRDLYTQNDGPRRWYFIRVDAAVDAMADTTAASLGN